MSGSNTLMTLAKALARRWQKSNFWVRCETEDIPDGRTGIKVGRSSWFVQGRGNQILYVTRKQSIALKAERDANRRETRRRWRKLVDESKARDDSIKKALQSAPVQVRTVSTCPVCSCDVDRAQEHPECSCGARYHADCRLDLRSVYPLDTPWQEDFSDLDKRCGRFGCRGVVPVDNGPEMEVVS